MPSSQDTRSEQEQSTHMGGTFDPSWSDVLPARPRRGVLVAWALMALLNVLAGLYISTWPERQSDLESVREWEQQWLADGANLYATRATLTDYPPHAIVALSPLAVLPSQWVVPMWTAVNLGLALLAPYLALRVARPGSPLSSLALPMLMFLCWGGTRTLLQFSLLTLVCGLLAMKLADRRPIWSGVCLGLALMKPQIAAPFVLWALVTRRLRVAAIGALVVLAGFAIFCVRAQTSPIAVLRGYADIIGVLYLLDEDLRMIGLAELRPLIFVAVPHIDLASVLAIGIAAGLLLLVVLLAMAERHQQRELPVGAPPLAAVWSLLTFYHLTYGFLLLLPVATMLMFNNDPANRTLRRNVFWIMQAALMVDVPGMWPRLASVVLSDRAAPLSVVAGHADRILMAALFVCLLMIAGMAGLQTPYTSRGVGRVLWAWHDGGSEDPPHVQVGRVLWTRRISAAGRSETRARPARPASARDRFGR